MVSYFHTIHFKYKYPLKQIFPVYPSLDNSDDEDYHIFKPRGRSKVDEAWNPKARVGPLLPKMNRPAREGTKKQAIEKVLEAAAAKRASMSAEKSPKRQYRKKKVKAKELEPLAMSSTTLTGQVNVQRTPVASGSGGGKSCGFGLGKIVKYDVFCRGPENEEGYEDC